MAAKKKRKKMTYHSNLAGPYKKKAGKKSSKKRAKKARKKSSVAKHHKAHTKAGTSYAAKVQAHIKASDIIKGAKRRGKRWTCGGPVRSGCGGSNSKVIR